MKLLFKFTVFITLLTGGAGASTIVSGNIGEGPLNITLADGFQLTGYSSFYPESQQCFLDSYMGGPCQIAPPEYYGLNPSDNLPNAFYNGLFQISVSGFRLDIFTLPFGSTLIPFTFTGFGNLVPPHDAYGRPIGPCLLPSGDQYCAEDITGAGSGVLQLIRKSTDPIARAYTGSVSLSFGKPVTVTPEPLPSLLVASGVTAALISRRKRNR